MPKRTLRVDIEADDVFIKHIDSHIKAIWGKLTKPQQGFVRVLVKALNESRQARVDEFATAAGESVVLDDLVSKLRSDHSVPVMVCTGRSGGYRLPVSRADCDLFLQAEAVTIYRRIEKLLRAYKGMAAYSVTKPNGFDSLSTVYKAHKLEAMDRKHHER